MSKQASTHNVNRQQQTLYFPVQHIGRDRSVQSIGGCNLHSKSFRVICLSPYHNSRIWLGAEYLRVYLYLPFSCVIGKVDALCSPNSLIERALKLSSGLYPVQHTCILFAAYIMSQILCLVSIEI